MITQADLAGLPADVAHRVIATAVSIAPCLHTLVDQDKVTAVAILVAVGKTLSFERPNPHLKAKTLGPKREEYVTGVIESAFTKDDRAALQGMCSATSSASATGPVGCFPAPSAALSRLFSDS